MKRVFIPYCFFILIIIILADMDRLPLYFLMKIPRYDWLAHAALYGLFYKFLNFFLQGKKVYIIKRYFSYSLIITSILITTEEFSQIFIPSRTFSLIDLLMGFIGIFIVRMSEKFSSRFKKKSTALIDAEEQPVFLTTP